jgi:hypothetical protein
MKPRYVHAAILHRYRRGVSNAGGQLYGYSITCTCGWGPQRINGTKREAISVHRDHVTDENGIPTIVEGAKP